MKVIYSKPKNICTFFDVIDSVQKQYVVHNKWKLNSNFGNNHAMLLIQCSQIENTRKKAHSSLDITEILYDLESSKGIKKL